VQARDPVKCLATAKKWGSQMMGVMVAGLGMHCYVVRSGLGAGPNLTCTCLYLSILALSKTQRGLGRCAVPFAAVRCLHAALHAAVHTAVHTGLPCTLHTALHAALHTALHVPPCTYRPARTALHVPPCTPPALAVLTTFARCMSGASTV
jgi:hypothetical protein